MKPATKIMNIKYENITINIKKPDNKPKTSVRRLGERSDRDISIKT